MSVEEMRRQMRELTGATPIPDDALARHAALLDGLMATIAAAARDLSPEDEAGTFAAHLERLAAEAGDDR